MPPLYSSHSAVASPFTPRCFHPRRNVLLPSPAALGLPFLFPRLSLRGELRLPPPPLMTGPRSLSSRERLFRALLPTRLVVLLSSFSHVGQFHPLSIRYSHCSRVSRLAEVKPSDDFLAGTWFRARFAFFLSLRSGVYPSLFFSCPLSSTAVAVVTDDRSKGTHDRWVVTTQRWRPTFEVTDVIVNGERERKGTGEH